MSLPPLPTGEFHFPAFPLPFGMFPTLKWGMVSSPGSGWISVKFSSAYPSGTTPVVLATQGPRTLTPVTQMIPSVSIPAQPTITPPSVPAPPSYTPPAFVAPGFTPPTIPPPSLASLTRSVPSAPTRWGAQVRTAVDNACSFTLGKVPVIGGYLCSGVDATFGVLFEVVGDLVQQLYYSFDLPAYQNFIAGIVEAKVASDWNDAVAKLQGIVNHIYGDMNSLASDAVGIANSEASTVTGNLNSGLSDAASKVNSLGTTLSRDINSASSKLASDASATIDEARINTEMAVNSVLALINMAYGLISGLSVPVAMTRNITNSGFEVYSSGSSTPIYYIAIGM